MMDTLTQKARQVFANDRYATELSHIEVVAVELDTEHHGGKARCTMALSPEHLNARGSVMGGALFTLADLAFAAAANAHRIHGDSPLEWVSVDSSIRYLRAATQGTLSAQAVCVKQGRGTCFYTITITDDSGRIIATVDTTGVKV